MRRLLPLSLALASLAPPTSAQLEQDVDLAAVRRAAEHGTRDLAAHEEEWRARLVPGDEQERAWAALFGYSPPGRALTVAYLYGFLYEREGRAADAVRAAELLARYAGYRDEVPEALVRERVEYAGGLPAITSFFHLPDYAETWRRVRACPELPAATRATVDAALASGADFVLTFPEWGPHNRAMLRALGLLQAAEALPAHPDSATWRRLAAVLAADSLDAWEIEDAAHYQPIWLFALMRYAELAGERRALDSPQVRWYLRYTLALLAPNGTVPDFGDAWWRGGLAEHYACLAWGAALTGEAELAWAARRVYGALGPAREADLGRALLFARLFGRTDRAPEPREPDPELPIDDLVGKKVVVRTGWEPDALYLCLNYRDEGEWGGTFRDYLRWTLAVEHEKAHHGHADENAIVLLMDGGSVLLHDAGYRDVAPSGPHGAWRADVFHNRLVSRPAALAEEAEVRELLLDDGHYRPVRTRRIDQAPLGEARYSRTRVEADGWTWDRVLVVLPSERAVAVVDTVALEAAGERTFSNLWAVGEVLDRGPGWALGATREVGGERLPDTRELLVQLPGVAGEPPSFPLERHRRVEEVLHETRSGSFASGTRLDFVTLLWSVAPGTDTDAVCRRARLVPVEPVGAGVALEIDGAAGVTTLVVKTDLELGITAADLRPRYDADSGTVRAGALASDGDVLLVRISGAEARWAATNVSRVSVGELTAFEARPFQVFQTSGRSSVVGRSRWRRWDGVVWLD